MNKADFDAAVETLLVQFEGSMTSGRRTVAHNQAVGGVTGSAHTWGLGADVVWDKKADSCESLVAAATDRGLHVIHEKDHDHFQPMGWVNQEAPHL